MTRSNVFTDPVLFAATFLKILDKRKRLIPLVYNRAQLHYLQNRTRRDIILKARQLGFSTMLQAEMFRIATTRSAGTMTLSHKSDSTEGFRRMAGIFYDELPESFKPLRRTSNKTTVEFDGMNSVVSTLTAGGDGVGHSFTTTHQHWSENARWKNGEDVVAGALQAGTPLWVANESTPNGPRGYFYDTCMAAQKGKSNWRLHFYPWWWDDDYSMALEPGERLDYTDAEALLALDNNLTQEQIKWRRLQTLDLKNLFAQQYPEDINDCFSLATGSIYPNFSREKNVDAGLAYDPLQGYVLWGVDDGYTNERTVLICQQTNVGGLNVLWEYAKSGVPDSDSTINECFEAGVDLGIPLPDLCLVDASAARLMAGLHARGLSTAKGNNGQEWNVENGISHVRSLICDGNGVRMIKIHPRCTRLIESLQAYHYDKNGKPVKVDDHLPDALRYACRNV